jgi:tetratricopeptide (TPR) repeat protein
MHWIDLDKKALAALVEGDEDRAIDLWTEAVKTIETIHPEPTVEVGQVYYRLGKCLADRKDYERAIPLMQRAESTIFEADPGSEIFQQLRYTLGSTLSKAGRSDEALVSIKKAMGIVSAPLADCLVGPKDDDVSIRELVTIFQKMGLASELNKREFTRIKKAIIKADRATADDDSIHPLDLFYTYYLPQDRRKADKFVLFQNFEPKYDLPTLIKDMNIVLDMVAFRPDDVVSVNEEYEDSIFYLIVDPDDGPMAARLQPGDEWNELVCAVNSKLMYLEDPRRFLRLESVDEREQCLVLLSQDQAVSLYRAGAGYIFENLSADLEPQPPLLVSLEVE